MLSKENDLEKRVENIILKLDKEVDEDKVEELLKGLGKVLGTSEKALKNTILSKIIGEKDYLIVILRWAYQEPLSSGIEKYIDDLENLENLRYAASIAFENRECFDKSGLAYLNAIINYKKNRLLEKDMEKVPVKRKTAD